MQTVYVDPSVATEGAGTIASPFMTVNKALTSVTQPFSILIKRGTHVRNNDYINDTTGLLKNTSGAMSYIGSYGVTQVPALDNRPKWYMNGLYNPQIQSTSACWLDISGIDFHNQVRVLSTLMPTRNIYLTTIGDTNGIANVFVHDCGFFGDPKSNTMQNGGNQRVQLLADSTVSTTAHYMKVWNCVFVDVGSGVYIRGNTNFPDMTTNVGDSIRSYGCSVKNCTFVNLVNCAVLLHTVASATTRWDSSNIGWSGFENCSYTSYRWDKNGSDAAFWYWHSNRVGGQYLYVAGMQAMARDGMAFDIDGMNWDCGFRFCYTQNNVSSFMFVSGSNAALTAWDNTTSTYHDYFYGKRMGSGNNVFEYIFSFNDGVQRLHTVPAGTDSSSEIYASCIRFAKCQFNCQVNNCVFIDTVSDLRKLLINSNAYNTGDNTLPCLTFNSNLFYSRYLTVTTILNHVLYTNDTVSTYVGLAPAAQMLFNNNLMFSLSWASGASPDMSLFTSTSNIFTDPYFEFLPMSAPSGIDAAKNIKFILGQSPIFNAGVSTTDPDINGNLGNNIGWLQK